MKSPEGSRMASWACEDACRSRFGPGDERLKWIAWEKLKSPGWDEDRDQEERAEPSLEGEGACG